MAADLGVEPVWDSDVTQMTPRTHMIETATRQARMPSPARAILTIFEALIGLGGECAARGGDRGETEERLSTAAP